MTAQEAYAASFCKTASDNGVDPEALLKMAEGGGILDSIASFYNNMSPDARRAAVGGLVSGGLTYALSEGDVYKRLLKALIGGGAGAAGTYALSNSGIYDSAMNAARRGINKLQS